MCGMAARCQGASNEYDPSSSSVFGAQSIFRNAAANRGLRMKRYSTAKATAAMNAVQMAVRATYRPAVALETAFAGNGSACSLNHLPHPPDDDNTPEALSTTHGTERACL